MSKQTHFNLALGSVLLLACLAAFLFVRPVFSQQATVGFCVATNGTTADTTILDGGGAFYPSPQVRVEQTDTGFAVEARVEWKRGRIYIPMIGGGS